MNTLDFHKTVQLFDLYGPFLTKKQHQIMTERFLNDYSLSEIAERLEISRSAVQDTIHKATLKLETFERHLNLLETQQRSLNVINDLEKTELSEDQKRLIQRLKDVI
jgi:predicted DNA-binding protein YlxM (UPF0122 family)